MSRPCAHACRRAAIVFSRQFFQPCPSDVSSRIRKVMLPALTLSTNNKESLRLATASVLWLFAARREPHA